MPVAKIIIRMTVHMVSPLQAENASGNVQTWNATNAMQANKATRGAGYSCRISRRTAVIKIPRYRTLSTVNSPGGRIRPITRPINMHRMLKQYFLVFTDFMKTSP